MTISLVSFFNTSNIGDLLISRALKEKVEKYGPVDKLDYLGTNEVKTNIYIENNHVQKETNSANLNSEKKLLRDIIHKLRLEGLILLYHSYFDKFEIPKVRESIEKSEALIIGGGNMIFDLIPSALSASRFNYFVETAKKYDKKIFAISIGIGPFQNNYQKKYAVRSLSKCDYITFRDKKSYDIFKKEKPNFKNAFIVADPVFFSDYALFPSLNSNSIGINIINPSLFPNDQVYQEVIDNYSLLIDKIVEKTNRKIIIFNTESRDFDACVQVFNQCTKKDNITIKEVKYEDDLYETYSKCELIIGTRMHSLITAFAQNIPIIGLSWQQKVDAMFEMIDDSESVFKLFEINASFKQIIDKCEYKLKNDGTEKRKFVMEKLLEKEKENDAILEKLLN